jgi:hypothetical protein
VAWGFLNLFFWWGIFGVLFGVSTPEMSLQQSAEFWEKQIIYYFGKRNKKLLDSKAALKEISMQVAIFFQDVDWAPSDILVGIVLLKREQKRIIDVKQARRLILEQPPGYSVPLIDKMETLVEIAAASDGDCRVVIIPADSEPTFTRIPEIALMSPSSEHYMTPPSSPSEIATYSRDSLRPSISNQTERSSSSDETLFKAKSRPLLNMPSFSIPENHQDHDKHTLSLKIKPWFSNRRKRKVNKNHHRLTPFQNMEHGHLTRESIDDVLHYARYAEAAYNPKDLELIFENNNIFHHSKDGGLFKSPFMIM